MSRSDPRPSPGEAVYPHPQIGITLNYHRDTFDNITVTASGFRPGEHVEISRTDVEAGQVSPIPYFSDGAADDQGIFAWDDEPSKGEYLAIDHYYGARGDQSGETETVDYAI